MRAKEITNEDTINVKNVKALLRDHPDAIFHMHEPSDDLIIHAMKEMGDPEYFISKLRNPSEKVLMAAIKLDPGVITSIRRPTENMWMIAIKDDPSVIGDIKKQTPAMQMMAYNVDPSSLKFISKPTPELIKLAVEQGHSKYLAHAIDITDAKTQLDAVKTNAKSAYHMKSMKPATLKWLFKNNKHDVVVGVISNVSNETIEESKTEIIRFILRCIKEGTEMGYPYEYPNMRSFLYTGKHSLIKWLEAKKINWPELEIIKKSLKSLKTRELGEKHG